MLNTRIPARTVGTTSATAAAASVNLVRGGVSSAGSSRSSGAMTRSTPVRALRSLVVSENFVLGIYDEDELETGVAAVDSLERAGAELDFLVSPSLTSLTSESRSVRDWRTCCGADETSGSLTLRDQLSSDVPFDRADASEGVAGGGVAGFATGRISVALALAAISCVGLSVVAAGRDAGRATAPRCCRESTAGFAETGVDAGRAGACGVWVVPFCSIRPFGICDISRADGDALEVGIRSGGSFEIGFALPCCGIDRIDSFIDGTEREACSSARVEPAR